VITGLRINILDIKSKPKSQEKSAVLNAKIEISGLEELDKLFDQLKQVKEIMEVRKV